MKKRMLLLGLFILIIVPSKIYAISGSASCSGPSSVELGETFSVTISGNATSSAYWQSNFVNSSGNLRSNSGTGEVFTDSPSSSFSRSYSFTAIDTGTASVSQYFTIGGEDGSEGSVSSSTCSISIVEATKPNGGDSNSYSYSSRDDDDDDDESSENKSSNSYLKSLKIDGVKISPDFDKDKMSYSAAVSGDKEKINVSGELDDDKASVTGFGEKDLVEGINKIEVIVTAENGEVRTYTILVTRKEKDPIEITINKKKYTVSKKDIGLKVPDGFVKTSVVIDKQEVVAYSNSFTGYILVALVDEDGKASWYIYNSKNDTYSKYSEFESDKTRLIIIEAKKKDVPHRYKKCTFVINDEEVVGYALELNSSFRLVYALNMKTGEKNFYLYDMDQGTFQRFYDKQVSIYRELLKKLEIVIIALASIIGIMFIIIISQVVVNKKTKRFIRNGGKEEKDELKNLVKEEEKNDVVEQNIETDEKIAKINAYRKKKNVEPEEEDKPLKKNKKEEVVEEETKENEEQQQESGTLSKKEMKKRIKEEKRKLKEERERFLS